MPFIKGEDRNQINLLPNILDDYVSADNPVRVIDAYVDSLNLEEMGFKVFSGQNAGQKPYKRENLLKLYLYCYLNRIRSSRMMEIETTRNIELMWLIGKITPDHGTLSAFMKDNKKAVKQLFREFTLMLKGFGLIDGKLIAIDGTKIKANNAKGKYYNENIIKKKIEYFESKIEEYVNQFLETAKDNETLKQTMTDKIEVYNDRIAQLNVLKKELKEQGKNQVCLTDPDSKSMKNNGKFEVCFNMQTAVDNNHKLFVDFEVVNDVNDQSQLSNMVNKAKKVFEEEKITVVADTGYFNMSEIIDAVDDNTEVLIKRQNGKQDKIENGFDKVNFRYDKVRDVYICPMGYLLEFKWNGKQNDNDYKRYTCENYMDYGKKDSCTSAKGGRTITRLKEEEIIEMIDENTKEKNDIHKKRGSIVGHPFGTIKRHFGYTYFLTRGLYSVNAEGSFICLAYNLKRLINILGVKELIHRFREIRASKYRLLLKFKIMKNALLF